MRACNKVYDEKAENTCTKVLELALKPSKNVDSCMAERDGECEN